VRMEVFGAQAVVAVARRAVFPAGVDSIVARCINATGEVVLCRLREVVDSGAQSRWVELVGGGGRQRVLPYGRRTGELMMRAQTERGLSTTRLAEQPDRRWAGLRRALRSEPLT
jgi:hypothetical protein